MNIEIISDHNIKTNRAQAARFREQVEGALKQFGDRILRVDVYLSAANANEKGSLDLRCMMETHLEDYQPMVVTHQAANLEQAVGGAAGMLCQLIGSAFGTTSETGVQA